MSLCFQCVCSLLRFIFIIRESPFSQVVSTWMGQHLPFWKGFFLILLLFSNYRKDAKKQYTELLHTTYLDSPIISICLHVHALSLPLSLPLSLSRPSVSVPSCPLQIRPKASHTARMQRSKSRYLTSEAPLYSNVATSRSHTRFPIREPIQDLVATHRIQVLSLFFVCLFVFTWNSSSASYWSTRPPRMGGPHTTAILRWVLTELLAEAFMGLA